jgi:transcriptional regulator with GAF, ATPase, and Fis domain
MKNCIVCLKPIKSTLSIASYCVSCRKIVNKIQSDVDKTMKRNYILPASGNCADCGKPATCYDHRYYSKPLKIEAVCTACNTNRGPALDVVLLSQNILNIKNTNVLSLDEMVNKYEHDIIVTTLADTENNMAMAARKLKVTYRAMRYKIDKHGIKDVI